MERGLFGILVLAMSALPPPQTLPRKGGRECGGSQSKRFERIPKAKEGPATLRSSQESLKVTPR